MQIPVEITCRGIQKTDEIEKVINEKIEKLERVGRPIIRCGVTIEKPNKHQQSGSPFYVRIEMSVPPGHDLVVKREPGEGDIHDTLLTVIRDAFEAAKRKLQNVKEKQRKEVKQHPDQQVQAFVSKLFPDENYGFLKSLNGYEVYFHKNSVLHNEFDRLKVGIGVRYVEEEGEKGPQASTVAIVDNPPGI